MQAINCSAQIIPGGWLDPGGERVPELNQALAKLAKSKTTQQSPIIIVDHYNGWISRIHTYDGVHPNNLGESRMAIAWFRALDDYLSNSRNQN
ncbi:MAG: hypothetical protein GVY19_00335 [Bacteroidetes bacterium]|jgi:lysophospholipase L1-like esterase|nr:hypothetical protein [Bacteroidota bacterium]